MASKHAKACHRRGEIVTAVIVWLLLGAIVNVAVAWGCSISIAPAPAEVLAADEAQIAERRGFGYTERCERPFKSTPAHRRSQLPYWSTLGKPRIAGEGLITSTGHEFASGWPLRALYSYEEFRITIQKNAAPSSATTLRNGIALHIEHRPFGDAVIQNLPTGPIWPGFAINTIFYAAIMWLLFAAPGRIRRWRRRRRGLCPKCAYDLRGTPHPSPLPEGEGVAVCTECGAAVPTPRA